MYVYDLAMGIMVINQDVNIAVQIKTEERDEKVSNDFVKIGNVLVDLKL